MSDNAILKKFVLITVCTLAVLAASGMVVSEGSDAVGPSLGLFPQADDYDGVVPDIADSEIIDNLVLADDMVYDDRTNIIINPDATISLGNHVLDFGSGSTVYLLGQVTIDGDADSALRFGKGTAVIAKASLLAKGLLFDLPGEGMDVSFTGTLVMEAQHDLVPEPCNVVTFDYTPVSPQGLLSVRTVTSGSDCCFQTLAAKGTFVQYDLTGDWSFSADLGEFGMSVVSEEGSQIYSIDFIAEAGASPTILVSSEALGTFIEEFNVVKVVISSINTSSHTEKVLVLDGLGDLQAEVDPEACLHLSVDISSAQYTESAAGEQTFSSIIGNLHSEVVIDLTRLLDNLLVNEESLLSSLISSVDSIALHADTVSLSTSGSSGPMLLSDVGTGLVRNDQGYYEFVIGFDCNGNRFDLRMTMIEVVRFSLTEDMVMDITLGLQEMKLTAAHDGTQTSEYVFQGTELDMSSLDIGMLREIAVETGTITLQNVLDWCSHVTLSTVHATSTTGSDESASDNLFIDLRKNTKGLNLVTLGVDSMEGTIHLQGTPFDVDLEFFNAVVETDAVLNGEESAFYSTDSHTKITISMVKFYIHFPYSDSASSGAAKVCVERSGQYYHTDSAFVEIQSNYTASSGELQMRTKYDFTGYIASFEVNSNYIEIPGTSDIKVSASDMIGSTIFTFRPRDGSTEVGLFANLNMSVRIDVYYYGIDITLVGTNTSLNISSSSKIDIKGYDYRADGVSAVFTKIVDDDVSAGIKGTVTMDSGSLESHQEKPIEKRFSEVLINIGLLDIDKQQGKQLTVVLDDTRIFAKLSDGSTVDKFLEHFVTVKDLGSGEGNGSESLFPVVLLALFVSAAIFATIMAFVMRRKKQL